MQKRVQELLQGRGGSYVLPFFWQHGEDEATLRDYMRAIYEANIREVCVECRPHPDFCGPKWWTDMDIIMDEARTRGMRVWLLDDSHFPTGYANGGFIDADPSLCKKYLSFATADVAGPMPEVNLDVYAEIAQTYAPSPFPAPASPMRAAPPVRHFDTDKLMRILAYQIDKGGTIGQCLDITEYMDENGMLTWDVPTGMWRIYIEFFTQNGGGRPDYMNVLCRASVRVLIDHVYEPTYAHYKDDFGKTFAGFFSDEPLMGNFPNNYAHGGLIGSKHMSLPWNEEVPEMLRERLGEDWELLMPMLWDTNSSAELTGQVRHAYMDAITLLIREHFSYQLGDWCRAHGVEYIGHIVEDMNSSSQISSSLGHYFRSLDGQDMGGIDVIGGGTMPGGENRMSRNADMPSGGDFYHFMLAKLASSHAHIDPKKKGRSMVELYGAYGWNLGISSMRYIADNFLLRGVNHYVPHAFSPKAFPDPDCPPHYYAHGENPQYRAFGHLMAYVQRVSHLISGGKPSVSVALLHSDMARWAGKCMTAEVPARVLAEGQIDFFTIPSDVLDDAAVCSFDGKLQINGLRYDALVVPEYEFITGNVMKFAEQAKAAGFPVLFINSLPKYLSEYNTPCAIDGTVVPLEGLVAALRELGACEVTVAPACEDIRHYHYTSEDGEIYLLSNENTGNVWTGSVTVPTTGDACIYDAMANVLRPLCYEAVEGGTQLNVTLKPYEPIIVVFGDRGEDLVPALEPVGTAVKLSGFDVSICESKEYPNFRDNFQLETAKNIAFKYPDFSGFIRYETSFSTEAGSAVLELNAIDQGVEVWCNDQYIGMQISPSYLFDLTPALKPGENKLRIEVATTLDRKVRAMVKGGFSMHRIATLEPSGLVGDVTVWTK